MSPNWFVEYCGVPQERIEEMINRPYSTAAPTLLWDIRGGGLEIEHTRPIKLRCEYCGRTADANLDLCPSCGAPLPEYLEI